MQNKATKLLHGTGPVLNIVLGKSRRILRPTCPWSGYSSPEVSVSVGTYGYGKAMAKSLFEMHIWIQSQMTLVESLRGRGTMGQPKLPGPSTIWPGDTSGRDVSPHPMERRHHAAAWPRWSPLLHLTQKAPCTLGFVSLRNGEPLGITKSFNRTQKPFPAKL